MSEKVETSQKTLTIADLCPLCLGSGFVSEKTQKQFSDLVSFKKGLVASLKQRLENEQGIVTLTDNDETEDVLIGIKEVLVLLGAERK